MKHTQDCDLLLGILALQMDFIDREVLIAAVSIWVQDKQRRLSAILMERKAIDQGVYEVLQNLVDKHIETHDGDLQKSLGALRSFASVREALQSTEDADLQETLTTWPIDEEHVAGDEGTLTVGASSSGDGRFHILRPHAKGGLGEVFIARDAELNREVALKEIQRKANHVENRARFLLEAEITGRLEHPGIVPVYGLGQHLDGRPFYTMRFIRGKSLREAIKDYYGERHSPPAASERSIQFRKLLGRFIDVCNAIEYAHSRGVLHRDLKPGNIMVGEYGETLVVDWGLAKASGEESTTRWPTVESTLVPRSSDSTSAVTVMGEAIGTPAFMSPEQAAGRLDLLDRRSDVYGLGATLYAVLTGRPPFEGDDTAEILRKVQAGESAFPRSISPHTPQALEAVCLKAMAFDPRARYGSPRELAEDVEAWLADEPTTAWPEPLSIRCGRVVRRHQTALTSLMTAGLVALISLGLGLGVVANKNDQLQSANTRLQNANQREREAAETAQRHATTAQAQTRLALETLRSVVLDIQRKLKGVPAAQIVRKDLLKTALGGLERVSQEFDTTRQAELHTATALLDLGSIYVELGDEDGISGTQTALKHYQDAVELLQRRAAAAPDSVIIQRDLLRAYVKLGRLHLTRGDVGAARPVYERGLELSQAVNQIASSESTVQRELATCHSGLSEVWLKLGDSQAAISSQQEALKLYRQAAEADPDDPGVQHGLLIALGRLANLQMFQLNDEQSALATYEEAVKAGRKLSAAKPMDTSQQSDFAAALEGVGAANRKLGDSDAALQAYQQALEMRQRAASADPANAWAQRGLSAIHQLLARVYSDRGDSGQAVASMKKAVEIRRGLVDSDPQNALFQSSLAYSCVSLGEILLATGDPRSALESYEQGVSIRRRLVELDPKDLRAQLDLAEALERIGGAHSDLGDKPAAMQCYVDAMEQRERLLAIDPNNAAIRRALASGHYRIGNLQRYALRFDEASISYRKGLETLESFTEPSGDNPFADEIALIAREVRISENAVAAIDDLQFASTQPAEEASMLLVLRGLAWLDREDVSEVADTAAQLRELGETRTADLYNSACFFSRCVEQLSKESAQLSEDQQAAAQLYQREAIESLRMALEAGHTKIGAVETDVDFDAIRDSPEFQSLLKRIRGD